MDAERLAAIEEWFVRLSRFIGQGSEAYAYFQELKASIDALQAENERLREVVRLAGLPEDTTVVTFVSRDALQARVTLLEGLLREAWTQIPNCACDDNLRDTCSLETLNRSIDAALSRSDADG